MKVVFAELAWAHYLHWIESDQRMLGKLNGLIEECMRHPFSGTGKPEPLTRNLAGFWSRRISQEHRLIYRVSGKGDAQALEIAQCRYHY